MKTILALLCVSTEQEAVDLLTTYNAFLSDVRAATGTTELTPALAAVQRNASLLRQLEASTGKQGQAALDAALAWKEPAAQSAQLATQVATLEADKSTRERDSYIAFLSVDHPAADGKPAQSAKLPASLHAWAKTQTKAQLEAWAAAAPPVTLGNPTGADPKTQINEGGTKTAGELTAEEAEACRQLGQDPKAFLERKAFEAKQPNPQAAQAVNPGV